MVGGRQTPSGLPLSREIVSCLVSRSSIPSHGMPAGAHPTIDRLTRAPSHTPPKIHRRRNRIRCARHVVLNSRPSTPDQSHHHHHRLLHPESSYARTSTTMLRSGVDLGPTAPRRGRRRPRPPSLAAPSSYEDGDGGWPLRQALRRPAACTVRSAAAPASPTAAPAAAAVLGRLGRLVALPLLLVLLLRGADAFQGASPLSSSNGGGRIGRPPSQPVSWPPDARLLSLGASKGPGGRGGGGGGGGGKRRSQPKGGRGEGGGKELDDAAAAAGEDFTISHSKAEAALTVNSLLDDGTSVRPSVSC